MTASKVLSLSALAAVTEAARAEGRRIVLCHGTFDLLHAGHIKHLQSASRLGDLLVVTLTGDQHVNKGPGRPVFNELLRADSLAALDCVNYVGINQQPTGINVIETLKPHVYVKGNEYRDANGDVTGNIVLEQQAVESHGGRIHFTDEITFSSSQLLNEHFGIFSQQTREYLQDLRRRYADTDIHELIDSLTGLKVLVLGDAIVDEYQYTSSLGQSGKGNILAVKYEDRELFAGGAMAVANHCAGFSANTSLLTALGAQNSHEDFIRSRLDQSISPHFFYRDDGPTVLKRRFVDVDMAKLFEVYFFTDRNLPAESSEEVCQWLEDHVAEFDAVIVADFGNGFIDPAIRQVLTDKARFLAVNTQMNSGNRGYHVITHYARADFISLNEPELRLAAHERNGSLENLAFEVAAMLGARHVAVTRGTRGALLCDVQEQTCYQVPALSTKVVDRIGAGDSFLSLAALSLAGGLPAEVAVFAGSAAAALDVQVVCNREPIAKAQLFKYITTLLKWD